MSRLTKENLLEVRGLIERGWTCGSLVEYGYNEYGDRDPSGSASYCLAGAIAKVVFDNPYVMIDNSCVMYDLYDPEINYVFEEFVGLSNIPFRKEGAYAGDGHWDRDLGEPDWIGAVYNFNDETNQETVLAAIDTAVANLE